MLRTSLLLCCAAIVAWATTARADEVLVTALAGEVGSLSAGGPLAPFVRLKPGEEPRAPKAKPATPWTYGNVPAEVE